MPGRTVSAVAAVTAAWIAGGGLPAAELTALISDGPVISQLAVTANGQTLRGLAGGGIVSLEASPPTAAQAVVEPADGAEFLAVGCLPGDVVAVVARAGTAWSLRTYRPGPNGPVVGGPPLQEVPLGEADAASQAVDIAISRVRGWLAVTGLPPPLPPVVRAAVAGFRVGPFSDRDCPAIGPGERVMAAAVGPFDELVLAIRQEQGDQAIAYHDAAGREVLRLAAGLTAVGGLEMGREDGLLWAVGTDADGRTGLWRLDAGLRDGQQIIMPFPVAALESPRDLACSSPRAIVVSHGPGPAVTSVNPIPEGDPR